MVKLGFNFPHWRACASDVSVYGFCFLTCRMSTVPVDFAFMTTTTVPIILVNLCKNPMWSSQYDDFNSGHHLSGCFTKNYLL